MHQRNCWRRRPKRWTSPCPTCPMPLVAASRPSDRLRRANPPQHGPLRAHRCCRQVLHPRCVCHHAKLPRQHLPGRQRQQLAQRPRRQWNRWCRQRQWPRWLQWPQWPQWPQWRQCLRCGPCAPCGPRHQRRPLWRRPRPSWPQRQPPPQRPHRHWLHKWRPLHQCPRSQRARQPPCPLPPPSQPRHGRQRLPIGPGTQRRTPLRAPPCSSTTATWPCAFCK